jgi:hypothetical protein
MVKSMANRAFSERGGGGCQVKINWPLTPLNLKVGWQQGRLWMRNSSLHSREHCNALPHTIHLSSRTQYRLDSTGMARKWDCWVSTPLSTTSMLQTAHSKGAEWGLGST